MYKINAKILIKKENKFLRNLKEKHKGSIKFLINTFLLWVFNYKP